MVMLRKDIVYIIVLNFNNAKDTLETLKSLDRQFDFQKRIILIDNASSKQCVKELEENISDDVIFIKNSSNLGYAAGNNVGIKYAIEHDADYIAILNNDVIANSDSFDSCINLLKEDKKIGVVGPAIVEYCSNKVQSTGAYINFMKLCTPIINHGIEYEKRNFNIQCDYVGGACMLFRGDIISEVGYLPENYFLFWEETEWCYRVKKHGYKVICTLNGFVKHKGSATINKIAGIGPYYMERNKVIFAKRNTKNMFILFASFMYLILRLIIKGIVKDKKYFLYLQYYWDGFVGKDKYGNLS